MTPPLQHVERAGVAVGSGSSSPQLHVVHLSQDLEVLTGIGSLAVKSNLGVKEAVLDAAHQLNLQRVVREIQDQAAAKILEEVAKTQALAIKLARVTSAFLSVSMVAAMAQITLWPFTCSERLEIVLDEGDRVSQAIWSVALQSLRKHSDSRGLHTEPSLQLVQIKALHNPRSWEKYQQESRRVLLEHHGESVVFKTPTLYPQDCPGNACQAFLFHGTSRDKVRDIQAASLRCGTRLDCKFGQGIYLTENLSQSDLHCKVAYCDEVRTVFLCRSLLGNAKRMNQHDCTLLRAPEGYHSVWGATKDDFDQNAEAGCLDSREYVIYDACQVHVQYLLEYVHTESCRCLTCS